MYRKEGRVNSGYLETQVDRYCVVWFRGCLHLLSPSLLKGHLLKLSKPSILWVAEYTFSLKRCISSHCYVYFATGVTEELSHLQLEFPLN